MSEESEPKNDEVHLEHVEDDIYGCYMETKEKGVWAICLLRMTNTKTDTIYRREVNETPGEFYSEGMFQEILEDLKGSWNVKKIFEVPYGGKVMRMEVTDEESEDYFYLPYEDEYIDWLYECAKRIYIIEEQAINEFDIEKYIDKLIDKGLRTFEEYKG